MIATTRSRSSASTSTAVLRPVDQEALTSIAATLRWSEADALRLAVAHLHQSLAHGLPIYLSLPPFELEP